MTKKLKEKLDAAMKAVDAVMYDKSGPKSQNAEALEEIRDHIEILLEALQT